jgi:hypothetical protein
VTGAPTTRSPIDRYLDELMLERRGRATDVRRILTEVEDHLRAAVEDGATEDEAVARFGTPRDVARRFAPGRSAVVADLARAAWLLAAVGLIAIGLSGVSSMAMRAAFGSSFVAGDPVGVTYTPARCADFLEYHGESHTCEAAASAHHADEVQLYRMAVGILGVLALAVWRLKIRRPLSRLPIELVPAIGAAVFGLVGAGLLAQGLSMLAEGPSHGPGQWLSAGSVAIAVAAVYGMRLLRHLHVRAAF